VNDSNAEPVGDQLMLPWEVERRTRGLRDEFVVPTRKGVINAYADWLQEFPLSSFVTFTWSDEQARNKYIYTDRAAVKDILWFLDHELRYAGQYFGVIEDTEHRGVPHGHVLMQDGLDWNQVWWLWKRTRGFFCSRPAESGAFYYCAKYIIKDGRCAERVFERLVR